MANEGRERDLVLAPQQFAYVQDETKGNVNTFVGPYKTSLSNTDKPVRFNNDLKRYEATANLEAAVHNFPFAQEGDYIVLENPAEIAANKIPGINSNEHPGSGNNTNPPLNYGRKINIAGPATFALWPGQNAKVIKGHTLRSNQYLVVRVYNEDSARDNWANAVLKRQTENGDAAKETERPTPTFITGKNLVIRGTEYSFFIPPTGIEVIPDEESHYVRDAVTLERLEYCILINEKGEKRYERGPQVVFPDPTETFIRRTSTDNKQTRRFRAYDLTKLQGLYIQVIADYNNDGSEVKEGQKPDHLAGEELFITGAEQAIYYPRPEHAIIKYGDQEKHNAVAVPEGEARYVMHRLTGEIELIRGPKMFLPDPRKEVIVRRILTPRQVDLWFPGNTEAHLYNEQLALISEEVTSSLANTNFVTDLTVRTSYAGPGGHGAGGASGYSGTGTSGYSGAATKGIEARHMLKTATAGALGRASNIHTAPGAFGDQLKRGTRYTPPRTVTLDTKYDGAVMISPHVGYAVQIVSKTGERKQVVGPAVHLLEYDETLEVASLSTGKPKNTDALQSTVYLKVHNNKVSDIFEVETSDMCVVSLKLSYRVNFEGDSAKWFAVDNYVKLLCDHIRSRLKAIAKNFNIEQFYQNATTIIRDAILGKATEGKKREGLYFEENDMRVYDVEVIKTEIEDAKIATMLQNSMVTAFQTTIQLSEAGRRLEATKRLESIDQEIAQAKNETKVKTLDLQITELMKNLEVSVRRHQNLLEEEGKRLEVEEAKQNTTNATHSSELGRLKARADQDLSIEQRRQKIALERIEAEAKALVEKFNAFQGDWTEAMLSISNNETMQKMAQASAPLTILGGGSIAEVLSQIFSETPLKGVFEGMKSGTGTGRRALTDATAK